MLLIGLDAASSLSKFGYSVGFYEFGRVRIESAGLIDGNDGPNAIEALIAPAIKAAEHAVVAIDAPLGWPATLAAELAGRRAGEALSTEKDALFQRLTDLQVYKRIGKKPLEIGADRIARAAHRALDVLHQLRLASEKSIPLAWSPQVSGACAIEVYPAATLLASDLPHSGYKKKEQRVVREAIALGLESEIPDLVRYVDGNVDVFDACLCMAAAKDFVDGRAIPPNDLDTALVEGWIWVRARA